MAQDQIRRAAELIKQGEKGQAGQILRGVLRQDQNNAQGWWLLSLTQEDQDKAVRCLERVLSIDPNHAGAKKRLAKLRPQETIVDDALPDFEPVAASSRGKAKNDDAYWSKLSEAPKKRATQRTWVERTGRSLIVRFAFVIIIGIGAMIFGFVQNSTLRDSNGNTPTDVALLYERAYWLEDYEQMVDLTCPTFRSYTDELWQNSFSIQDGVRPADLTANFDDLRSRRIRLEPPISPNEATVAFYGSVSYAAYGEAYFYDFDADIEAQGGEVWIGHNLKRVEGEWLICDGPDLIEF